MFHHGIIPVDEGRELIVLPDQEALMPLFGLLEHEAQSCIVALILDAGEAASPTLETDPASFPQADPIERVVCPGRERLGEHRIQVVSDPGDACRGGKGVQPILREAVPLPQGAKGNRSLLLVRTRNGASPLPRRICPHATQAFLSFREQRIVEDPSSFQVGTQAFGLPVFDQQGQFERDRSESGGFASRFPVWGLGASFASVPSACLSARRIFVLILPNSGEVCQVFRWRSNSPRPAFPSPKQRCFIPWLKHKGFRARIAVSLFLHVPSSYASSLAHHLATIYGSPHGMRV